MSSIRSERRLGFTLVEMTIVIVVLAVLATLVVGRCSQMVRGAKVAAAQAEMREIRDAFGGAEGGYLRDLSGIPGFTPAYLRVGCLFVSTNVFGCKVVEGGPYGAETRGTRLDEGDEAACVAEGRAPPRAFTTWDEARGRGWRGPYLSAHTGEFPSAAGTRFAGDATFAARGFFPSLSHLRLPREFKDPLRASVYGFVGEPALIDPWGNPYVVQVPPPQSFLGVTNVPDAVRFSYARVVSAGPDGRLDTPCFGANTTHFWGATGWSERRRRMSRQAGLIDGSDRSARGDDLVLFFSRNDVDEGESFDR